VTHIPTGGAWECESFGKSVLHRKPNEGTSAVSVSSFTTYIAFHPMTDAQNSPLIWRLKE
jgi:hypothetical protein